MARSISAETTRQGMHLGAARAIEAVHASNVDRYARQLTEHYLAAGDTGDLSKLERYAETAITQAMQAFAQLEARALLLDSIEALGLPSRSPAAARFVARNTGPLFGLATFEERRELCETAADVLWEAGGDHFAAVASLSAAQSYSGSARRDLLDFPKALDVLNRAMPVLKFAGDHENLTLAKNHLVNVLFQTGDVGEADRIAEQEMREGAGPARQSAAVKHAYYMGHLGRISEARELQEATWAGLNPVEAAVNAFWHHRAHLFRLRAPSVGLRLVDRGLRELNRYPTLIPSLSIWALHCSRTRGVAMDTEMKASFAILRNEGLWDEARQAVGCIDFAEGEWGRRGLATMHALLHLTELSRAAQIINMLSVEIGECERVRGNFARARELSARATELTTPPSIVYGHSELALIAAESGEYDQIATHAAACRAVMNDDDWLGLGARVLLVEALALLAAGERAEADSRFESALSEMRRVEHAWDPADAHYVYGKMLVSLGDEGAAAPHFQEAITIYERVEAGQPFLDRVRAAWPKAPARASHTPGGSAAGLSAREIEVLRLLAEGASNRQIAEHLTVSLHTVAGHVRHILYKTGCANRTEAARWAVRNNLT